MYTLNNGCEFIVDCLHTTAPIQSEGYPLIRTPNIGKGRLNLDGVFRVSQETFDIWTRRAVPQENDLILAREAPAGNVAIIASGQNVCLGQRTVLIRPDPTKVDPRFLCYYLLAPKQQGLLLRGATGATAQHVNMKDIRSLPLENLPKKDLQRQIGQTLTAYDDLIENNRRRMVLLEKAARLLYEEWFVRLRFPGYEHTPISNGLPHGWEKKPLNALCPDLRDAANPAELEPGTPYIGLEHMPRRSITLLEWGNVEDVTSTKLRYQAGDILFGKIRSYFHKVGFALTDGVTSSDAIVLRPIDPLFYTFSLLTVSSDWFVNVVSKTAKEGSKMPRADWKLMEQHSIPVPPRTILQSLNETIRPILDQLRNLAFQNQRLRAARDLLLPRLMSGEVEV